MTDTRSSSNKPFEAWEGSSVLVEQGRHWSSSLIWLTACLFGSSMLWLFTAKVDQTISVRGLLQPSVSVREIESPTSGVVHDVFVTDGDYVVSGQSLLTVESAALTGRQTAIKQSIQLLQLQARSLQTIIEAKGVPKNFGPLPDISDISDIRLREKSLVARNQTEQLRSQLRQVDLRLASKKESLRMKNQIASDFKPLYLSGGIARNAYLQQLNMLQELEAEVLILEGERDRIVGLTISQLNGVNRQLISLKSDLASNIEAISYRTVKAPISGKVFNLKSSTYSVVSNSEILLKIVPDNVLVANIEISNADIGFVRTGLPVSVSVDSFPSGEFGYIKGELVSIGSDVLPPDRDSPFQYFPAQVSLVNQSVLSGTNQLNLQSGMGITANIKLRSRRAITLLTDIFTKQFDGVKRFR